MADTIREAIEDAAKAGIARVTADGTSVDAMDLDKLINADRHLSGQTAKAKNHLGLSFRALEPGGCG